MPYILMLALELTALASITGGALCVLNYNILSCIARPLGLQNSAHQDERSKQVGEVDLHRERSLAPYRT